MRAICCTASVGLLAWCASGCAGTPWWSRRAADERMPLSEHSEPLPSRRVAERREREPEMPPLPNPSVLRPADSTGGKLPQRDRLQRLATRDSASFDELKRTLDAPDANLAPDVRQQFRAVSQYLDESPRPTASTPSDLSAEPAEKPLQAPKSNAKSSAPKPSAPSTTKPNAPKPNAPTAKPAPRGVKAHVGDHLDDGRDDVPATNEPRGGAAASAAPSKSPDIAIALRPRADSASAIEIPESVATEPPTAPTVLTSSLPREAQPDEAPRRDPVEQDKAPASEPRPEPRTYRQLLDEAMQAIERDTTLDEPRKREVSLRLLQLAAQRGDEAVRPIDKLGDSEREFWKQTLHGLHVLLDGDGVPVASRRSTLALRSLRQAVDQLANDSVLDVRNLTFCREVQSFGRFSEFAKPEFLADQEVLLYVEVDNFACQTVDGGFETELRGSYEIFDRAGQRVASQDLPADKQRCRNRRRDYFIAYRAYMPKRIAPGAYTLQITIEDQKGHKFGQSSTEFVVKANGTN